jgi:sugar/nucleoside kinase (ribokinase family)
LQARPPVQGDATHWARCVLTDRHQMSAAALAEPLSHTTPTGQAANLMIEARNVTKIYHMKSGLFARKTEIRAVDNVSISVRRRENRLGGAANVARNIKALGAEPVICSVIGDDFKGDEFLQLLENENMTTEGIIRSPERITTTKFRVLGNNTQMLRVDEEITEPLSPEDSQSLAANTERILLAGKTDAVIFQDYDKGTISTQLIEEIIARANENGDQPLELATRFIEEFRQVCC